MRRTSFLGLSLSLAFFAMIATIAAGQSSPLLFPESEYDKTLPRFTQSVGNSAQVVASRKNVFEPIRQLREDDRLRRGTRAVGMLVFLVEDNTGKRAAGTCTATLVDGGKAILTNHHCIPGNSGTVKKARFLLDFYHADSPIIDLPVATEPTLSDRELDFAIVPLLEPAPADIQPVAFASQLIQPRERLFIVHHPIGMPKMLTQFGCAAHPSMSETTQLRHRCDTLGGSSGAPIFNQSMQIVGIHHRSGLTPNDPSSFNLGSRIIKVAARAPVLGLGGPAPGPGTTAVQPAAAPEPDTIDTLNGLISGN